MAIASAFSQFHRCKMMKETIAAFGTLRHSPLATALLYNAGGAKLAIDFDEQEELPAHFGGFSGD